MKLPTLWIDQWGGMVRARTVKELKAKAGPGRVFKIYVDGANDDAGKIFHVGYGVGRRWFTGYYAMRIDTDPPEDAHYARTSVA